MTVESIIFFELVVTIFILALTIIMLIVYFSRLTKKFQLQRVENESKKNEIDQKNSYLLDTTRQKTIRIIDEANNKALDIIQQAHLFAATTNDNFNEGLKAVTERQLKGFEKATSDYIKIYQSVLDDLKSKNIEIFQNISNNIEISTLGEIKKFKVVIEQATISSQKMLKKKIDHEYSLAKKDIDSYKQNELNMINERIYEILEKVSKLVLGQVIELSQHEELIIDSLEKAKKEAIFDNER